MNTFNNFLKSPLNIGLISLGANTLTLRIPNFQLKIPKTVALAQHNGTRVLRAAHGNPYH